VPYAGDPKGVMITHANLVCAIAGCNQYLESFNETLGENDSYLSFLPLAHVFDRCGQTRECVESSSMLV
jgi:long-chain acyl-CoA synthetase